MSSPTTGTSRSTVVTCPHCGKRNRVAAVGDGVPKCGNCHNPVPWIADAGDDDFAEVAERAPLPVVVDLWATWCGPCRMVSPALEQLATERAGEIKLVKVDVDSAPKLSQRFEVRAVPTLMVLRDGEVIARQPGAAPLPALRSWLDQALTNPTDSKATS
ncbi:thioredoxin [Pseudonocardia sp. T1-2H]|uniref:thioredoxin n=1 Tax=Pseudonocardia sp. T1-2H TaxID=3128899 RepID=UPI0031015AC9